MGGVASVEIEKGPASSTPGAFVAIRDDGLHARPPPRHLQISSRQRIRANRRGVAVPLRKLHPLVEQPLPNRAPVDRCTGKWRHDREATLDVELVREPPCGFDGLPSLFRCTQTVRAIDVEPEIVAQPDPVAELVVDGNLLTDAGVSSSNIWTIGGAAGVGFNLLTKPAMGDLLGTIVTNMAPTNKNVVNTWAARDLGAVASGFTNNAAIGWLALDGMGTDGHTAQFTFNGSGVSNALYVDCLQLLDAAAVRDNAGNLSNLAFNTNIVIYYAQALIDGVSVAEKLNHKNNDHLRWVPTYAGNFSSVSLVYPDGSTNIFNAALATSPNIDSNGNGIPNAADPSPFFVPSQINLTMTVTNSLLQIQWNTIPLATNYVFISTNMYGDWQPFTNFNRFYYGAGAFSTNLVAPNAFVSPQLYPSSVTNVWIYDTISTNSHYYRVEVHPWLTYPN